MGPGDPQCSLQPEPVCDPVVSFCPGESLGQRNLLQHLCSGCFISGCHVLFVNESLLATVQLPNVSDRTSTGIKIMHCKPALLFLQKQRNVNS